MVFARTKLVIHENVYMPHDTVKLDFPIKDTKKFYENVKDILMNSYAVDERQIQETSFSWDKANNFSAKWIITKELDDLTYCLINVKIKAKSGEDSGSVSIELNPVLKTEYPQDTIFQKSFFYEVGRMIVDKMFYEKQRMKYLAEMQRLTKKLENALKSFSLI